MAAVRRRRLLVVLAALLALAVRFAAWPTVFAGPQVTLLADGDPLYHVLRAEALLHGEAGWFDPRLDWPHGADVLWPPLFDGLLAGVALVVHGAGATRGEIAATAALVPPVLGALAVLLGAALAAALAGARAAPAAALFLALLQPAVAVSQVGRPDQHALEIPLAAGAWLAFALAWRAPDARARRAAGLAAGAAIALAFWNWMGSALVLAIPALAVALLHLAGAASARRAAGALATAAGAALALLVPSVLLLGPPGAWHRTGLAGLGLLHLALVAGCGLSGTLLAVAPALRTGATGLARRGLELLAALAVPAALTLGLSPGLRAGAWHGLTALAAASRWHAGIAEFKPMIPSGRGVLVDLLDLSTTFGLLPLLALSGLVELRRPAAAERSRAPLAVLVAWTAALLGLALWRNRFGPYAALPLAGLAAAGLHSLGDRWPPRRRSLAVLAVAAVAVLPGLPRLASAAPGTRPAVVEALSWLGTQPPGPPGREAVLAQWDLGHAVRFWADRPVLASPFGSDVGQGSVEDLAAFAFATDEVAAQDLLRRRRIGWVVLQTDFAMFGNLRFFAPSGTAAVVTPVGDLWSGRHLEPGSGIDRLVPVRLMFRDGNIQATEPALAGFRLLDEAVDPADPQRPVKVWGPVAGARVTVTGVPPGGVVALGVAVHTPAGRDFEWWDEAAAGPDGKATLRVAYATGPNGACLAGPVTVRAGGTQRLLAVPEVVVVEGREVTVPFGRAEGSSVR